MLPIPVTSPRSASVHGSHNSLRRRHLQRLEQISRAFSQSRWTVRSDTPRTAAISLKEKPQKYLRSTTSANAGSLVTMFVGGIAYAAEIGRRPRRRRRQRSRVA
jgi:hypothetical protein